MKYLLAFLFSLTVSGLAFADTPSAASLEKLMTVTQADKLTEQMLGNLDGIMQNMINQSVVQNKMTDQDRKVMENFMDRTVKIVKEELSWQKTKPIYIQVYSESFTQNEIDDLLAFYATPGGQALIEKMPIVMNKLMSFTQARMVPMIQRMQEEMKKAVAEVKARQKTEAMK